MKTSKQLPSLEDYPARGIITESYCHFIAPMGTGKGAVRWYKVSSIDLTSKVA